MPQTGLNVVRCPGCNTAYNAASLPPGKGFRCKKCSTVVGGSPAAPTPEPAQTKRPSSRIDRKASGSTSRRTKPEGRPERGEKSEKPATGRSRGGQAPAKKPPVMYIAGGVLLVAIIGLAVMAMGDKETPKPKKTEESKVEEKKVEKPSTEDDISKWDLGGHETDFAKQRKQGFSGQDKSKIDPITGQGTTDEPPPAPEEPPKDELGNELPPENKDQ